MATRNIVTEGTPVSPIEMNKRFAAVHVVGAGAHGVAGDGNTDDRDALHALANATIDNEGGTIEFVEGTYVVRGNLTIPSHVALRMRPGAKLKPSSGVTITINGPFDAPLTQVFDVSAGGTVVVGAGAAAWVVPQWWGARMDGVTDDSAAIAGAIAAAGAKFVPPGTYRVGSGVTLSGEWQFADGAKLRPDNGVQITVGATARIYATSEWRDTSAGGSFAYANDGGVDLTLDGPSGYGPSVVRGFAGNLVADDIGSALIAGGGAAGFNNVVGGSVGNVNTPTPNEVQTGTGAHYSAIIGGYDNVASGLATILGGFHNYVDSPATHGTIVGGSIHKIQAGDYNTIVGGNQNTITQGDGGFIGGGLQNTVNPSTGGNCVIAGGFQNVITADTGTIAGGSQNTVTGVVGTIAGGIRNIVNGQRAFIGGGDTNTVGNSATYGVVGGGFNNEANAYASAVLGGEENVANGQFSEAMGFWAIARLYGERAHAAGRFATIGDAQTMRLVARNQTTDATPTELFLDGADDRITIPNNTTWAFSVLVSARRSSSTNESAAYKLEGCIDRASGADTTALVGSVTKTVLGEDVAAWDVDASADTTNGALKVEVTGEAAKTINWVARIDITQVTG